MKDLEIRGAGDLLGGEQSGFINEIERIPTRRY
jgi:transcription-repair coupling factor (superfamily II helicase)